jgi:hypothetical protein
MYTNKFLDDERWKKSYHYQPEEHYILSAALPSPEKLTTLWCMDILFM